MGKWIKLKHAGTCKVCGEPIPAGELAFWDSAAKTVTHHKVSCAEQDGLTERKWVGSPVSGKWVPTIRAYRL